MASNNVVIRFNDDDDDEFENTPPKKEGSKEKSVEIEMKDVEEIVVERGDSEAVSPEELIEPLKYLQKLGVPSNYLYYVNQRKNMFFLAIGIILMIIFIAIIAVAVYVYLDYFSSPDSFDYDGYHYNTTTYITDAFAIKQGEVWSSSLANLEHPTGDTAIHSISIALIDESGASIPIEKIYPIEIEFSIDDVPIGRTQGGNSFLFKLPAPYAIHSTSDSIWSLSGNITNLFGFITEAEASVRVKYSVYFSPYDLNSTQIVNYYILSDLPLPTATVLAGQDNSVTFDYTWVGSTQFIIEANPLVSIGAIDCTLSLKVGGNSTAITTSSVAYSDSGYITSVDIEYPYYEPLNEQDTISVTTIYDNSITLPNVISAFAIYGYPVSGVYDVSAK